MNTRLLHCYVCAALTGPEVQSTCVQLANCGLSDVTITALGERGIKALFPIQKHVYEPAAAGRDLIGRARTGSGKTLAFALPVVEKLLAVSFHLVAFYQNASRCYCLDCNGLPVVRRSLQQPAA